MLLSLSSRSRPHFPRDLLVRNLVRNLHLPVFDFAEKEFFGFQANFFYTFHEERKFLESSPLIIHRPQRCIDIYRASSKCHCQYSSVAAYPASLGSLHRRKLSPLAGSRSWSSALLQTASVENAYPITGPSLNDGVGGDAKLAVWNADRQDVAFLRSGVGSR
jgi:hypothetical protein